MDNFWIKRIQQLEDFVERNNIRMGEPSGKYSRLIKTDYIVAIKNWSDSPKSIITCERLLVDSITKCRGPSVLGAKFYAMHQYRIRAGKPPLVQCGKCSRGTKTNRDCARDAEELGWMNI